MTETIDRTTFIGGSDIPAILGISRYKTLLECWAEKTGTVAPNPTKSMRMRVGTKMEDVIAELWMEETGKVLQRVTERRTHPKYPHFRAQIDRIVVGEDATWEGKSTNWRMRKDWGNDQAPQEAICQAMWGLGVTGKKHTYICGLIDNADLCWVRIDRDPVLIAEMQKRANAFWEQFVIPKVMPMQIVAGDADILYQLFPHADPASQIDLGDEGARKIESRNAMIQDKISLEKQIDTLENEIKAQLGTTEAGVAGKWRVTWKEQARKEHLVKASTFRAFRITELKETSNGQS